MLCLPALFSRNFAVVIVLSVCQMLATVLAGPNESNEAYLPPLVKTNKEMTKEATGADAVLKLAALTLTSEAQSQRVEELIPKMELGNFLLCFLIFMLLQQKKKKPSKINKKSNSK